MRYTDVIRHWAALRALLVFTVILGIAYPLLIWLIAQLPGLRWGADGSIINRSGDPVASALIGQAFTDADGNPLPQYFQSRPSASDYDPLATGGSNLGPEDIVDTPDRTSLLTQVCARSAAIGRLERVSGARPFCTGSGVGAVLAVMGPRTPRGDVVHPTSVVSINESCTSTTHPFLVSYNGVTVQCATPGVDYSTGQIVPVRGDAAEQPQVPADAVTASGSGVDPDISPAYAELQIPRVAQVRHLSVGEVRALVDKHRRGREFGFLGQERVNVVALNLDLDQYSNQSNRR